MGSLTAAGVVIGIIGGVVAVACGVVYLLVSVVRFAWTGH